MSGYNNDGITIPKDVLARMRHDMRTPLGALVGLVDILEKMEPLSPTQAQIVMTMHNSIDDLVRIMEQVFEDLDKGA